MMNEQKKEYTAPELTVVEMERQAPLLNDSFNGETGCAPSPKSYLA